MRREFSHAKSERETRVSKLEEDQERECNSSKPEDWPDDESTDNKGEEFDINPGPSDLIDWVEGHPNDD